MNIIYIFLLTISTYCMAQSQPGERSFRPGTLVKVLKNWDAEFEIKPIELVEPGEMLRSWSIDDDKLTFPKVINVTKFQTQYSLYTVELENGQTISTSDYQEFSMIKPCGCPVWREAQSVIREWPLQTFGSTIGVKSIMIRDYIRPIVTYYLEVDKPHSFFIIGNPSLDNVTEHKEVFMRN